MPPIIENNTYIPNFHLKTNIFNEYFVTQCKNHDNDSVLPNPIRKTNPPFLILLFLVSRSSTLLNSLIQRKVLAMLQFCAINFPKMCNFWNVS